MVSERLKWWRSRQARLTQCWGRLSAHSTVGAPRSHWTETVGDIWHSQSCSGASATVTTTPLRMRRTLPSIATLEPRGNESVRRSTAQARSTVFHSCGTPMSSSVGEIVGAEPVTFRDARRSAHTPPVASWVEQGARAAISNGDVYERSLQLAHIRRVALE